MEFGPRPGLFRLTHSPVTPTGSIWGPPVLAGPHLWGASWTSDPFSWLPRLLTSCPGPSQWPLPLLLLGSSCRSARAWVWQPRALLLQPPLPLGREVGPARGWAPCHSALAPRLLGATLSCGPTLAWQAPSSQRPGAGWMLHGCPSWRGVATVASPAACPQACPGCHSWG